MQGIMAGLSGRVEMQGTGWWSATAARVNLGGMDLIIQREYGCLLLQSNANSDVMLKFVPTIQREILPGYLPIFR